MSNYIENIITQNLEEKEMTNRLNANYGAVTYEGIEMLRDRFENAVQREYERSKKTMDDNLRLMVGVDGAGWDELDEFQDWLTSEGHSWEMSGDEMFIITNSEG